MALNEKRLKEAVQKQLPVFGFFSVDAGQLEQAAEKTIALLGGDETEVTRLEGPAPSIEEIVLAAGTISFFSTKRIIYLPMLKPTAYKEADFKELCSILAGAENSVLVLTCQIGENWGRPSLNKTEQRLLDECGKLGMGELLAKPGEAELVKMICAWAAQQKAEIKPQTARMLLDNCGPDAALLQNETAKLAAYAGYAEITPDMVRTLGTHSLEADAFDMADLLNQGKTAWALQKLEVLLRLQNEPVAICAAITTGYLDMYRLCAAGNKPAEQIAKDFGYRSAYRLNKKKALAGRLGKKRLRGCLQILLELDAQMKSMPDDRKPVLLQTALCEFAAQQSAR